MKHKHVGPPDKACTNCFREAWQRADWWEKFWRVARQVGLIALLLGLAVAMMLFLSSKV